MKGTIFIIAVIITFLFIFPSASISQTIWYVSCENRSGSGQGTRFDPFSKIQYGIDAALSGDTVFVMPGTYAENIDFLGKAITLKSVQGAINTVIDGKKSGSVVTFKNFENKNSVLEGFLITNGLASNGGAIYCFQASPRIRNNTITLNNAIKNGGGIYCKEGSPTIANNQIDKNTVLQADVP